jgi:NhaA family Na+:H+ antiporter
VKAFFPKTPKKILNFFVSEETRSSALLVAAGFAGLIFANSILSDTYVNFLANEITIGSVTIDVKHLVNDALMAVFFLIVGIEVKRELIDGELRGWKRASFPVIAALGGMLLPALIFTFFNPATPESRGWAIPMATDIAIAMGVLGLLGKRIPKTLRIFLLSLAIVDDIASILVIALFYNQPTNSFALILAVTIFIVMAVMRQHKKWPLVFLFGGIGLVYFLLLAGVSATIAGVLTAALIPLKTSRKNTKKIQTAEKVEEYLLPITMFGIVPLFVFVNAGVSFAQVDLASSQNLNVFLGIVLGLALGKPLGIFIACWLGSLLGFTSKPRSISWGHVWGVGSLAGIGFTIALLITDLAYRDYAPLQAVATFGVFSASVISAIVGIVILRRVSHT